MEDKIIIAANTLKKIIEDSGNKLIIIRILSVGIILVGPKFWFIKGIS